MKSGEVRWYTKRGEKHLVCLVRTKGQKLDGMGGPLFAFNFATTAVSSFYKSVESLQSTGEFGEPISIDLDDYPGEDEEALRVMNASLLSGTITKRRKGSFNGLR